MPLLLANIIFTRGSKQICAKILTLPDELRAKETALSQAVEQAEDTYSRIEEFVPIIAKYTDITELNTYILNELIERIVVHEKTVDEDGSKSQRVDIYYKFVGYIQ